MVRAADFRPRECFIRCRTVWRTSWDLARERQGRWVVYLDSRVRRQLDAARAVPRHIWLPRCLGNRGWCRIGVPDFQDNGLLPPGNHTCSLSDVKEKLTFHPKREELMENLERLMKKLPHPSAVEYVLLDGSFAEQKTQPNDADVVVVVDDLSDGSKGAEVLQWIEARHDGLKKFYECDLYACDEAFVQAHWEDQFGHTRDGTPKGYLRLMGVP